MWVIEQITRRSRRSDWRSYFLIGCVLVLALLLAGASWSAWRSARERAEAAAGQAHTLEVLRETGRLGLTTLNMLRGERGYLLTRDDSFLVPYNEGRAELAKSIARLSQLTSNHPGQHNRVGGLEVEAGNLARTLEHVIALEQAGRHEAAVDHERAGDSRVLIRRILRQLDEIEQIERTELARQSVRAQAAAEDNETYQYLLAVIGLLLIGLAIVSVVYVRRAFAAEAKAVRALYRTATIDALTGIANRRTLLDALERRASANSGPERVFSFAIFDIDDFKSINDRFGHPAGDEVIREVARRANHTIRSRDIVGRIGGEEFGIVLPATGEDAAHAICERLRAELVAHPVRCGDRIIPVAASFGVAEAHSGEPSDRIMARADAALYEAKRNGRNQVRRAA